MATTTKALAHSNKTLPLAAVAAEAITAALKPLLADTFALYMKTKHFHWHVSGPHFRDYHELFDAQAGELLAMTDDVAERARKLGGTTLRSIGDIARHQRIADNNEAAMPAARMLAELRDDNLHAAATMREVHALCDEHGDIATASLLENWVDQAERRAWFLREAAGA
ncbi:MAG: DNA starvation/stationary phase protection protein, partial [Acidobacteriota bacterium]